MVRTLFRYAEPNMTAAYTHGNFGKARDAQRQYMCQLLAAKSSRMSCGEHHRASVDGRALAAKHNSHS